MIWVATWNGLCRWDGYEFSSILPPPGSPIRKYSFGINDIKTDSSARILWCFIDDNVVLFDVDTYEFYDLHVDIESLLGEEVKVKRLEHTKDEDIVVSLSDGRYLCFSNNRDKRMSEMADAMTVAKKREEIQFRKSKDRTLGDVPPYMNYQLAFSRKDEKGGIWLITREGKVLYQAADKTGFDEMADFDVRDGSVRYCCDDDQGNLWLRSKYGLHKLSIGVTPYTTIEAPKRSRLRASMIDRKGHIWLSWSDTKYLSVMDDVDSRPRYLAPDGKLTDNPVEFGPMIYGITQVSDSRVWLASKEKCLFRLTDRGDGSGFIVEKFQDGSGLPGAPGGKQYYDITVDGYGRLWISSMKNGIFVVENPEAEIPVFKSLVDIGGYPDKANRVRQTVILGDTLGLAVTTGGLLSFNVPVKLGEEKIEYTLHTSNPARPNSLGSKSTVGVELGDDSTLYVATASDGINRLISPLMLSNSKDWEFEGLGKHYRRIPDVVQTVAELPDGHLMIVGIKEICIVDPHAKGKVTVFGQSYWNDNMEFKEVKPLMLKDGRWIIGTEDGALVCDMATEEIKKEDFPIEFVELSIEGEEQAPLCQDKDTITLGSNERALTLTFAAHCYTEPGSVRYAYRMDNKEWMQLGNARTLTFNHLEPGSYKVTVRSTDTHGRWLDNEKSILIIVTPTFWETRLAKALYVLWALILIVGGVYIYAYMQRIRRLQRATLKAYLKLLETPKKEISVEGESPEPEIPEEIETRVSNDDRMMISRVLQFIEENFSNPEISVDDMATAASVSRSSLTRKMKSLVGVTPADFLKTTRMKRAAAMLRDSDASIKEIAIDCGFADMNYFGKCFKAYHGVTPGNYRKA